MWPGLDSRLMHLVAAQILLTLRTMTFCNLPSKFFCNGYSKRHKNMYQTIDLKRFIWESCHRWMTSYCENKDLLHCGWENTETLAFHLCAHSFFLLWRQRSALICPRLRVTGIMCGGWPSKPKVRCAGHTTETLALYLLEKHHAWFFVLDKLQMLEHLIWQNRLWNNLL